jgi:hypothetical protein
MPVRLKHVFAVVALAWVLLWLISAFTIGGVMGNSPLILSVYLGMAVLPPALLYGVLFWAVPLIAERFRSHKG